MNKIVREHYPVDRLPEDLREGLEPGATVRVVLEVDGDAEAARHQLDAWSEYFWSQKPAEREALSREALLEQLRVLKAASPARVSLEQAVAEIRALRDEWDD